MLKIIKLGGSTLSSSKSIFLHCNMLKKNVSKLKQIIVVSAIAGVTDEIGEMILQIKKYNFMSIIFIKSFVLSVHRNIVSKSLDNLCIKKLWDNDFYILLCRLEVIILNFIMLNKVNEIDIAYVYSMGERLSAMVMFYCLVKLNIDPRVLESERLFKVNRNKVNYIYSDDISKLQERVIVITGFSVKRDKYTFLISRGGSDYIALLFSCYFFSSIIEMWKDAEGIMDFNPKKNIYCNNLKKMHIKNNTFFIKLGILNFGLNCTSTYIRPMVVYNTFGNVQQSTSIIPYFKNKSCVKFYFSTLFLYLNFFFFLKNQFIYILFSNLLLLQSIKISITTLIIFLNCKKTLFLFYRFFYFCNFYLSFLNKGDYSIAIDKKNSCIFYKIVKHIKCSKKYIYV